MSVGDLADRALVAREKSSARAEESRRRSLSEKLLVFLDSDIDAAQERGVLFDTCVAMQTLRTVQAIHALMLPEPEDDDGDDD